MSFWREARKYRPKLSRIRWLTWSPRVWGDLSRSEQRRRAQIPPARLPPARLAFFASEGFVERAGLQYRDRSAGKLTLR